jgi:hypothetical protein
MPDIFPADLVLVGLVRTPRDLEIARVLGWYRLPLATAPRTLMVDWLAFYQTAAFGEERWSVRCAAPVRGYELTTRGELLIQEAAHPRAADPYFKVQLGPLERLEHPILAGRWRRFTFLYTTGERLLAARTLRELTVPPSRERQRLWRQLREREGKGRP